MLKTVTVTLLLLFSLAVFTVPAQAQRVIVTPSVYQTYGMTVTSTITTTSSAASVNIDTSPGMLYGLSVSAGAGTAVVYANFFNATSANVTAGTTAPFFTVEIDGAHNQGHQTVIPWGTGIATPYSTGLSVNCTTTRGTTSGGGNSSSSSGCLINALTKH